MAAPEEIWMPRKIHSHDRKSAYRNVVRIVGEVSDTFALTNGVKQGCVLAPNTFLYPSISNARRGFS